MELLSTILDPSNPNKQLKMIQLMNTNEKGNLTHCTIFDFIYYGHNTTPIYRNQTTQTNRFSKCESNLIRRSLVVVLQVTNRREPPFYSSPLPLVPTEITSSARSLLKI